MNKLLFWTLLLVIVVLSLLPVTELPGGIFNFWDKAQHALAYALLALLALRAYPMHRRLNTALALLLLGGLLELAQAASGWRYGEWSDLLANGVGIGLGITLWCGVPRLR
jgi:VanZ family protein